MQAFSRGRFFHVVPLVVAACVGWNFTASAVVALSVGRAETDASGVAQVPVEIALQGPAPAAIFFQVLYPPNAVLEAVVAGGSALSAGKTVSHGALAPRHHAIVVGAANDAVLADGTLVTLVFRVSPAPETPIEITPIAGNASAAGADAARLAVTLVDSAGSDPGLEVPVGPWALLILAACVAVLGRRRLRRARWAVALVFGVAAALWFVAPGNAVRIAGDVDGSGTVDAADLQRIVDFALGQGSSNGTDVDLSGGTDAVDYQIVVLALLGQNIDADEDGLSDQAETVLGTSINDPDSDNDLIPDGWEVDHDLNPTYVFDGGHDGDNDGITNQEEYTYNLDPHVADPAFLVLNEFQASNSGGLLDEDSQSSDWVEIYNVGASPVDLSGWSLTDTPESTDKWVFPATVIPPHGYLVVFASGKDRAVAGAQLHTNFSLDAAGEFLALYNPLGEARPFNVFDPKYPEQFNDYSYGWYAGTTERHYFDTPTPGAPNVLGNAFVGLVADTEFSVDRGFFDAPFGLQIATDTPGAVVRYTTDASTPTAQNGTVYQGPIPIAQTTCVRAIATKPGWAPSNVDTQTYIFPEQILTQTRPEGYPEFVDQDIPADYEMDPEIVGDPSIGPHLVDGLLAIPTLSVVTDKDNLFDPATGIYMNPEQRGEAWERPASAEFIYPPGCTSASCQNFAGSNGHQVNCGIRIQGNITRRQERTVKHPFRLLFKGEYGPTQLEFPLFGEDAADTINTIVVRAGYGNSWLHHTSAQRPRAQYIRDEWARDAQREVSGVSSHGIFVHLYLNGIYWGVYNAVERPDGAFAAAYFGGEQEDYDALNSAVPTDGDLVAWNELRNLSAAVANDPTLYPQVFDHLDVDQFIDYMILCFYQQNQDWPQHNWYGIRKREPGAGFMFFSWDAERIFESVNSNRINVGTTSRDVNSPAGIFQNLRKSTDFRLRFADRVHRLFFNDGLLTTDKVIDRWNRLSAEVEPVTVVESARWGDYRRDNAATPDPTADVYKYDPHWLAERQRLLTQYFPLRTDEMMRQFRNGGLYPNVDAPEFLINGVPQHGGPASAGDLLSMAAPAGAIYYTTDGADPRVPGGQHTAILPEYQAKRILVPTADIGDAWRTDLAFDDSAWLGPEDTERSLNFALTDQFIDCGTVPGSSPDVTLACWARPKNLHNANLLDKFPIDDSGKGWSVRVRSDGKVQFKLGSRDAQATLNVNNGYVAGQWIHIACTFSAGTARILLDGVPAAQISNVSVGVDDPSATMQIGQASQVNTGEQYAGLLRDVRVYDAALSEQDIQSVMAGAAIVAAPVAHWPLNELYGEVARDASGNGHDGLLDGSPEWYPGTGALGYDDATTYDPYISYDIDAAMAGQYTSACVRIPFSVAVGDLAEANTMTLQVRYDDGFVAYLNGVKVAEANAPATPAWDSAATVGHPDAAAVSLAHFDISAHLSSVAEGENLLAIHGLNVSLTSSDFLISAAITVGENALSPSAILYTGPIPLNGSTRVMARALDGSSWSALTDAVYAIGSVAQDLRVTEIMYHPEDIAVGVAGPEFIELQNVGTQPINLNLARFSVGIAFTFPAMALDPGDHVVLTDDVAGFQAKYGTAIPVLGPYTGQLSNGGEQLVLLSAGGAVAFDFTYSDGWYDITDGQGFSLVAVDPGAGDPAVFSTKAGWRPSTNLGGTPGAADAGALPAPGSAVINELLAHSHAAGADWIELHNTTNAPINLGGWFLSDDVDAPTKYRIADGVVLPAMGYLVFDESIHFGNPGDPGATVPFAFSENGETAVLSSGLGGIVTGYRELEDFGASATGVSLGRHVRSDGGVNFVAMQTPTPGAANSGPLVGPVVISEIMYDPGFGLGAQEYVVLTNIAASPVNLFDAEGIAWKFTDGIDYTFPPNFTLPAGGRVIVAADVAAFAARYGAPIGVPVLGPYVGRLDNAGERLQVAMPGDLDALGLRQYIRIDRVVYENGAPWPTGAAGGGFALRRINNTLYGNDPANWQDAAPLSGG